MDVADKVERTINTLNQFKEPKFVRIFWGEFKPKLECVRLSSISLAGTVSINPFE